MITGAINTLLIIDAYVYRSTNEILVFNYADLVSKD